MAKLTTGGFLKSLALGIIKGDPLAVVDDIQESAKEEKKEEGGIIETEGEASDEKA
jgi:hypothetical protein